MLSDCSSLYADNLLKLLKKLNLGIGTPAVFIDSIPTIKELTQPPIHA